MQKLILLLLAFFCLSVSLSAQYDDPIFPKPSTGYGADGPYTVETTSFPSPGFPGEKVEIFYPAGVSGAVPTLFFAHGFGGTFSNYVKGMLEFVARKGYAIVFAPYPTTNSSILDRYDILRNGFLQAARNYPNIIDTTQVGFMGHSFGGGAMFGLSHHCFNDLNWGANGRLLFSLAPWYAYELTSVQLQSFPANTKLIMQVYDDDNVNDHRMAIDIFNNINIPAAEKDYILVKSDTLQGYVYAADHAVPGTYQVFDALDYYAFYRLLDALCDYTFHGNPAGKAVALGNGSALQVTMPSGLKPLAQSDSPVPGYPEDKYGFPCSELLNPRRAFCPELSSTEVVQSASFRLEIAPNPSTGFVGVKIPSDENAGAIRVFNFLGQVVQHQTVTAGAEVTLNLVGLPVGEYWVQVGRYFGRVSKVGG